MVQWSSGYDFCLTVAMSTMTTEGPRFDPGLNHFLLLFMLG